jgi:hypothetical protein
MAQFGLFQKKIKNLIYIFIYILPDKCKFILKYSFQLFFFAPILKKSPLKLKVHLYIIVNLNKLVYEQKFSNS